MIIETLRISNFRSFGPDTEQIQFSGGVTTFVGGNGAGKTAALAALARLFGTSKAQRTVQKADFHVATDLEELKPDTQLVIEVILAFPELEDEEEDEEYGGAVAEFWRQMAASGAGAPLKVRIRLQATWVDDGTPDGAVEEEVRWVTRLDDEFEWGECPKVAATDRTAVQMIYVPAARNAHDQVRALLRGRLWRAANWSEDLVDAVSESAEELQEKFASEEPIDFIHERLKRRWLQVHTADTDTEPAIRLLENRFETLVRGAEVRFQPVPDGQERELERLSDGQKSLFQIALTAATLEVEQDAATMRPADCPFDQSKLRRVQLTVLAVEEPENSLSPFFLSRIMSLANDIGDMPTAQVLIASHSASILSRVEPEDIRYFRQDRISRQTRVRRLTLPTDDTEARAYVRLAVKSYPELYFARFVVLAEGDSEQIILPRLAEAKGVPFERSFVPIVPLGGRYVGHFWRLLGNLEIPFATLLDLDFGRAHGGPGVIQSVVKHLSEAGIDMADSVDAVQGDIDVDDLDDLDDNDFLDTTGSSKGASWISALRRVGVFFSDPLDIDFSMLVAFPAEYKVVSDGGSGPSKSVAAIENRKKRTLKTGGKPELYDDSFDKDFVWYPYLFLQKSKPEAHLLALSRLDGDEFAKDAPGELIALIDYVSKQLGAPAA